MKLTTQMRAEIDTIQTQVVHLAHELRLIQWGHRHSVREKNDPFVRTEFKEELKTHKIRMENILCETDVKEPGHSCKLHDATQSPH